MRRGETSASTQPRRREVKAAFAPERLEVGGALRVQRTKLGHAPANNLPRSGVAATASTQGPDARAAKSRRGSTHLSIGVAAVKSWSPGTDLRPPKTLPVHTPHDPSSSGSALRTAAIAASVSLTTERLATSSLPFSAQQAPPTGLTRQQSTGLGVLLGVVAAVLLGAAVLLRLRHGARAARAQRTQRFGLEVLETVQARRRRAQADVGGF